MISHPVLSSQLQVSPLDALNETLKSHQYALQLDEANPDSLFNTAQVLTSLAEEIADNAQGSDDQAVDFLQQALQLFERCLSIQKLRYIESQSQAHAAAAAGLEDRDQLANETAAEPTEDSNQLPMEERWASIIEPVTEDTILDTILAEMATSTTLLSLLTQNHSPVPPDIEAHVSNLLSQTTPPSSIPPPRAFDLALAKANLTSAILESSFRAHRIEAETYARSLDAAFSDASLTTSRCATGLIAHATALISLHSAVADASSAPNALPPPSLLKQRFSILTRASALLSSAASVASPERDELISTHALRGDIALLQHRFAGYGYVLSNAAVFYGNAAKLMAASSSSSQSREDKRRADEVKMKARVVEVLRRGLEEEEEEEEGREGRDRDGGKTTATATTTTTKRMNGGGGDEAGTMREVLTDMVDEGFLAAEEAEMVFAALQ